jgi:hypothetical protein
VPTNPAQPAPSDNQIWAEPDLEIDESSERGGGRIDQEIRVLARANRLALGCDPATRHPGTSPGTDVIDFPLRCIAHAHPDCRFRWARITLDLAGTPDASISDLSPRDEISEHPVKISTKYGGGLKFDLTAVPIKPDVSAERATEQDVYFPTVTVSGVGFSHAIWDFTAVGDAPLHVDRSLRLLASVPSASVEVPVRLTLRASVTAGGFLGKIPLIGRQNVTIPMIEFA